MTPRRRQLAATVAELMPLVLIGAAAWALVGDLAVRWALAVIAAFLGGRT